MIGIILSFFAAIFEALLNTVVYKFKANVKPLTMGFGQLLFIFPFALVMLLFFYEIPVLSSMAIIYISIFGFINVLGRILYIKAVHLSGLAKTVPFLSFTPIFLIIYGFFDPTERLSLYSIAGVAMIIGGAFIISMNKHANNAGGILKFITKERGTQLALLTALVYAFTSLIARKAQLEIGPENKIFFFYIAMVIQTIIFAVAASVESGAKNLPKIIRSNMQFFIPAAILLGAMELCIFTSYVFIEASIAISIKRLAILFSVILGYLFFKEKGFKKNLFASSLMVLGVIIILVLGD